MGLGTRLVWDSIPCVYLLSTYLTSPYLKAFPCRSVFAMQSNTGDNEGMRLRSGGSWVNMLILCSQTIKVSFPKNNIKCLRLQTPTKPHFDHRLKQKERYNHISRCCFSHFSVHLSKVDVVYTETNSQESQEPQRHTSYHNIMQYYANQWRI